MSPLAYQFDASEFDRVFNNFKRWSKKTSQVFVTVDCDCELRVLTTKHEGTQIEKRVP